MKTYKELREINVNDYVEKKGQLKYLSWTWAVDTLLQNDPEATWDFPEPKYFGETVMVFCNVTAMGKTMKMQLPVMDNRNASISNPDSRKISDATMRCLAKCIACFGIGLYIYAGEDLPDVEPVAIDVDGLIELIMSAENVETLKTTFIDSFKKCGDNPVAKKSIERAKDLRKSQLETESD